MIVLMLFINIAELLDNRIIIFTKWKKMISFKH